jgi:hypothetical protein
MIRVVIHTSAGSCAARITVIALNAVSFRRTGDA